MDRPHFASLCPSFRSAPTAGRWYLSNTHHHLLKMIISAVSGNRPVLVLSGDPGIGKTTLAQQLGVICATGRRVGWIGQSIAQLIDLPHQVPKALGFAFDPSFDDPENVLRAILKVCHDRGETFLLIVDEAQALSDKGLEYLAGLTSAPSRGSCPIVVVLVGGLELERLLANPHHNALRSRIGGRFQLLPFTEAETAAYVAHRFRVSGCACHAGVQVFDAAGLRHFHALSRGIPRIINHLVKSCLFEATMTGRSSMDGAFVQAYLSALVKGGQQAHLVPPASLRQRVRAEQTPPVVAALGNTVPESSRFSLLGRSDPQGCHKADQFAPVPAPRVGRYGRLRQSHAKTWKPGLAAMMAGLLMLVSSGSRMATEAAFSSASLLPLVPAQANAARDALMPATMPQGNAGRTEEAPAIFPLLSRHVAVEAVPDPDRLLSEALTIGDEDPARAAQLYTRAALWGSDQAAYYMGQLYETGVGVQPDPQRAQAWYEAASNISGAAIRLAHLRAAFPLDPQEHRDRQAAAPVPVLQTLFRQGQTELHWHDPSGQAALRFRVEYVLAGGDVQVRRLDTTLFAVLIPHPVLRWRIITLQRDGAEGPASAWSRLVPAAR